MRNTQSNSQNYGPRSPPSCTVRSCEKSPSSLIELADLGSVRWFGIIPSSVLQNPSREKTRYTKQVHNAHGEWPESIPAGWEGVFTPVFVPCMNDRRKLGFSKPRNSVSVRAFFSFHRHRVRFPMHVPRSLTKFGQS